MILSRPVPAVFIFAGALILILTALPKTSQAADAQTLFQKFPRTHFCQNRGNKAVIYPFQNYHAQQLTLIGSADPRKIQHLIANQDRVNQGRYRVAIDPKTAKATVMLQAVNYLENSIGRPYQELIIYIQVKDQGAQTRPMAYVTKVYPNEPLALATGKVLGLKGELARANYQFLSSSKEVNLSRKGSPLFTARAVFLASKEKPVTSQGEEVFINSEGKRGRIAYSETSFQRPFDPAHDVAQLGERDSLIKDLVKADFKPVSWIYNPTSSFVVMNEAGAPMGCHPLVP